MVRPSWAHVSPVQPLRSSLHNITWSNVPLISIRFPLRLATEHSRLVNLASEVLPELRKASADVGFRRGSPRLWMLHWAGGHKPSPPSHIRTPSECPQCHLSYEWGRQFCAWLLSKALCTSDCKDQPNSSPGDGDLWNPHGDREYLGNRKLKAIIYMPNAFT